MPKVYLSKSDEQEARIIREIKKSAAGHHKDLARCWGISQQAASKRINKGNITLLDLWRGKEIFQFDMQYLNKLIGGK